MATLEMSFAEGHSLSRPPLFDGHNYLCWKARMRIFIQAKSYDLWNIIADDSHTLTLTKNEKKIAQVNAIAMNTLYCAISEDVFNQISTCSSAKQIWDTLETIYEGSNNIKESKIDALTHDFEIFKMQDYESISEMFSRFSMIINDLHSLGKSFTNSDLVKKMLRSLPRSYEAKVTAIQEAKDLDTLSLDELMGSLITHEMRQMDQEEDSDGGMKSVTFKTSIDQEESSTRTIKSFLKMKKEKKQRREKASAEGELSLERKKKGDLKALAKGEPIKRKEKDEVTNLCIMAHGDKVISKPKFKFSINLD